MFDSLTTFTDDLPQESLAPDDHHSNLLFRIVGTHHDGQLLRLGHQKCTIGSSLGCALSLRSRFVRPVHCVVLRGPGGVLLRSFGSDTRVNGQPTEQRWLVVGDRLSIGPIDLELLETGYEESEEFAEATANSNFTAASHQLTAQVRAHEHQRTRRLIEELKAVRAKVDELNRATAVQDTNFEPNILEQHLEETDLSSQVDREVGSLVEPLPLNESRRSEEDRDIAPEALVASDVEGPESETCPQTSAAKSELAAEFQETNQEETLPADSSGEAEEFLSDCFNPEPIEAQDSATHGGLLDEFNLGLDVTELPADCGPPVSTDETGTGTFESHQPSTPDSTSDEDLRDWSFTDFEALATEPESFDSLTAQTQSTETLEELPSSLSENSEVASSDAPDDFLSETEPAADEHAESLSDANEIPSVTDESDNEALRQLRGSLSSLLEPHDVAQAAKSNLVDSLPADGLLDSTEWSAGADLVGDSGESIDQLEQWSGGDGSGSDRSLGDLQTPCDDLSLEPNVAVDVMTSESLDEAGVCDDISLDSNLNDSDSLTESIQLEGASWEDSFIEPDMGQFGAGVESTSEQLTESSRPHLEVNASKPEEDAEESINAYMSDLLARLRGREPNSPIGASCPLPSATQQKTPAATEKFLKQAFKAELDNRRLEIGSIEYTPREAPEKVENLQSFRDVANFSARSAIDRSRRRKHNLPSWGLFGGGAASLAASAGLAATAISIPGAAGLAGLGVVLLGTGTAHHFWPQRSSTRPEQPETPTSGETPTLPNVTPERAVAQRVTADDLRHYEPILGPSDGEQD